MASIVGSAVIATAGSKTATIPATTAGNSLLVYVNGAGTITSLKTTDGTDFVLDYTSGVSGNLYYRLNNAPTGTTTVVIVCTGGTPNVVVMEAGGIASGASPYTLAVAASGYGTNKQYSLTLPTAGMLLFGSVNVGSPAITTSTPSAVFEQTTNDKVFGTVFAGSGAQIFDITMASPGGPAADFVGYSAASTPSFPSASSKRFGNSRHIFGLRR